MKTNEASLSVPESTDEYMLLFRGEHWDRGLSPEELERVMAQVMGWFQGLQEQGLVKAGQPLAPVGRMISGKQHMVADGPFTESKEVVGGYLLLQAESFAEAVAIAQRCPMLAHGTILEVRPVLKECPIFQRAGLQLGLATP